MFGKKLEKEKSEELEFDLKVKKWKKEKKCNFLSEEGVCVLNANWVTYCCFEDCIYIKILHLRELK